MYAALTYFGNGVLVCKSSSKLDEGKTVSITDGSKTWSGTMKDGKCEFILPAKKKYHINLMNSEKVEYETDVIFNFSEYKEIDIGLDKTSWKGLKAIVNAGLENTMVEVGDQLSAMIGGEKHVFDVVHVGYKVGTYGHNVVLAKHTALPNTKQMQVSNTNAGGYKATLVAKYLDNDYYNAMPDDLKQAITKMTFQASIGGTSQNLQNEEHNVWIPLEYNIFGQTKYAANSEVTSGGAEQFSYFVSGANRVKTLGNTGSACIWWESSPYVSNAESFCFVNTDGSASYNGASNSDGVVPCFLIAADPKKA